MVAPDLCNSGSCGGSAPHNPYSLGGSFATASIHIRNIVIDSHNLALLIGDMSVSLIVANSRGRCPHCLTVVRFEAAIEIQNDFETLSLPVSLRIAGSRETILLALANCPECGRLIISLSEGTLTEEGFFIKREIMIWPLRSVRPPVPEEVPEHIASDYDEAALVLPFSPKASAALSRRCLQAVLREAGGADQRNLAQQIDAVLHTLPSYIASHVDAVRKIGNFAAHPLKHKASGEILDVEPGEAEWNLDVLDQLFDFYYVQPKIAERKRDALNAKLAAAKEPPMK